MSKGLLGLDIGGKAIRFVYLVRYKGNYCVMKAGKLDIENSLPAGGILTKTIKDLIEREEIFPKKIFVAITKRDVVIHQVNIPKMSAIEVEEAVSGEIEKIPIFFQRNFDFIYECYPISKLKNKVIFAAIGRKVLDYLFHDIKQTKLEFKHFDLAPLNIKEVASLTQNSTKEAQAVLVVHDQQSYLAIVENKKYKLFYKISSGLESYMAAPTQMAKDQVLSGWIAEFRRVLKSFLLDNTGFQLSRLLLIWDKASINHLDQRLSDDLGLQVESLFLNKIKNITAKEDEYLNPIYNIALTPVLMAINNIKGDFQLNHFFRGYQIKKYLVKMALVTAIFLGVTGGLFQHYYTQYKQETKTLKEETIIMSDEIVTLNKETQDLFKKQEEYMEVRQRLLDQATYVQELNRVSWSEVFSIVANELPQDLALTSFQFSEGGKAVIKGEAFAMESISELIRKIEESAILEKGKFNFLKEKHVKELKLYNFGILANLRAEEEGDVLSEVGEDE